MSESEQSEQPEPTEQPPDLALNSPLGQLYSDLAGLERLQVMQFELIREIRRQLDELGIKLSLASAKRRRPR